MQDFRNWTWLTQEMQNLIEWMELYNQEHPENRLNFIGVDMQDGNHMIQETNKLLSFYNSDDLIEPPASNLIKGKLKMKAAFIPRRWQ